MSEEVKPYTRGELDALEAQADAWDATDYPVTEVLPITVRRLLATARAGLADSERLDDTDLLRRLQEADVTTRHLVELHEGKHALRAKGDNPVYGSMVEAIILWWEAIRHDVLAGKTSTPANTQHVNEDNR